MAQNVERASVEFILDQKTLSDSTDETGNFGFFSGYASTFGNMDQGGDVVMKGAFKSSLAEGKSIPLLWQHDTRKPIGKIMTAKEDSSGLKVEGRINLGTNLGKDAYALMKAGDLGTMSIGYITQKATIDPATKVRNLKQISLKEVSLVSFPMNEDAKVTAVKNVEECETLADIEDALEEKGFTRTESRGIISKIKKMSKGHSDQCDADTGNTDDQCDADSEMVNALLSGIKSVNTQLKKDVSHV